MSDGPVLASHRMMKTLVGNMSEGGKVDPRPDEFERVSRVFKKAGGSWERVFLGSVEDVGLLKKVLRIAIKKQVFTMTPSWGV